MRSSVTRRGVIQAALAMAATAARPARAATKIDVIVVGAGLSGLHAALTLEELGARVQVVEGRRRVGGRVYSLKDLPGQPEAGANGFGGDYARCLEWCDRLKVKLHDKAVRDRLNTPGFYFRDGFATLADWPNDPANIMTGEWKAVAPFAIPNRVYAKTNPLTSIEDWRDPKYFKFDVSIHDLFKREGFTDAQINLFNDTNPWYGTSAHDVSALSMHGKDIYSRTVDNTGGGYVIGGNSLLPEAMAAHLKSEVHLEKTVTAFTGDASGIRVTCADGSVYDAKYAVCTLPMPVMRFVRFDPGLPELHRKAALTVPYFPMTQVHLVVKTPFWEDDGRPAPMFTDTAAGWVMANRFGERDEHITSLTAWARGNNAIRLDQLDPNDAKKLVVAEIERLRPAAKGKLEAAYLKSWRRDPFAGGDYAIWGPGQVSAFVNEVDKPHGRIHFAGEHTAHSCPGMEGAMESGERVAQEIASLL